MSKEFKHNPFKHNWDGKKRKTERDYKNCNGSVKNLLREERIQGHKTVRRSERIKESTKDDVSPG